MLFRIFFSVLVVFGFHFVNSTRSQQADVSSPFYHSHSHQHEANQHSLFYSPPKFTIKESPSHKTDQRSLLNSPITRSEGETSHSHFHFHNDFQSDHPEHHSVNDSYFDHSHDFSSRRENYKDHWKRNVNSATLFCNEQLIRAMKQQQQTPKIPELPYGGF